MTGRPPTRPTTATPTPTMNPVTDQTTAYPLGVHALVWVGDN